MVKKNRLAVYGGVFILGLTLTSCNQLPPTARSVNGSGLSLSVPVPEGVSAKFTLLTPVLQYRVASGAEVFNGSVSLSQIQSIAGPLNINLPHDGPWLVSAEWLVNGIPADIGADVATVTGNTAFSLNLGTLNTACYAVSIANPGSNAGVPDTFNFDNDLVAYSGITLVPPADVQCLLGTDPLYPSVYLQHYPVPVPVIAYLGNGNWVDFTDIPPGTVFYNDSLTAKRAALGSTAVMAVDDVYAIKLSALTTAWIQVDQAVNTGATYVHFLFRLNRHGASYMKFDVTLAGDAACNSSGVSLY